MTDPSCDVANLLTPDRFWKSVDKRGRNFAGLAGVCRARPGRGRPIVCPVERTQRGIIPRRVTYTAAKPNRAGWIAYEYLAGDSRDDPWTRSCSTILNLAGKSDSWIEEGQTMEISLLKGFNDLKRIFASILPLLRILLRIAWTWPTRLVEIYLVGMEEISVTICDQQRWKCGAFVHRRAQQQRRIRRYERLVINL